MALKGKEVLPAFPNAVEDAEEVLLLVLFVKLNAELDPAEKAKLFAVVVDVLLLLLLMPPKEKG